MSNDGPFTPWRLAWRPEQVERFWSWYSQNPALAGQFFSLRYGASLMTEILRRVKLQQPVVDLGSGSGALVERLLDCGLATIAVDIGEGTVARLRDRFSSHPRFVGARRREESALPFADGEAGSVLLIEVLEHLEIPAAATTLREVRRMLKPGGVIVATTPNHEQLSLLETMCPACGCVFHNYQHLRSLSAADLIAEMEGLGFATCFCAPVLFSGLPRLLRPLHRWAYRLVRSSLPHLVYIGRRP
jgi:2-polyprenyl-3-methyl-5-hydroxy-6-metoxy-1,4-benzoquinol methylase